jgi:hypothetical protein
VLKFATAEILSVDWHRQPGQQDGLQFRVAHRHEFQYTPKHGMLYVRSRMISSRCNDNYDEFPAEEIKRGYRTFVGKPVFVNHHNDDHRRMRGVIIDAALHEDRNPDGSPDTWVEGLMEIDGLRYPKLAQAIIAGHIERTSMGVDVKYSVCSACGNKATTPLEYCGHVPGMKGKTHYRVTGSGSRVGTLIREACFGLNFFENSLLVEPPADPTAYTLGKPVLGPGLEHLARTASAAVAKPDELKEKLDGVTLSKDDKGYYVHTHRARSHSYPSPHEIPDSKVEFIRSTGMSRTASAQYPENWPVTEHAIVPVDPRSLVAPEPIARTAARGLRLVQATQCLACRCRDTVADLKGNAECFGCGHSWHEAHKEAALQAEAAKYDSPEEHPWFQEHPVHHSNIIDHWNDATPDEKASGERWYPDAHLVAKGLGSLADKRGQEHPHGNTHLAAGILANHSPQNGWAGNMHDAARVLHEGKGLGGKGSGMFASDKQRQNDDEMLSGKAYHEVLRGPKINDFAHLIENGGDKDKNVPHVVIDRHALGVAAGKGLSDKQYGSAPMSGTRRADGTLNRRYYDHVVNQYHEAGKHISEKEGREIPGHAVQAVTWLVRQRKNQEAERARAAGGADSRLDRGREKSRSNAETKWNDFRQQHLPDMHQGPGTGYQASKRGGASFRVTPFGAPHVAYGETKAPADVDTLRDENCPVCGEADAWNGNVCPVCSFVAPPKQFQDPDLDMAKQLDLRQQQNAYDNSIQPGDDASMLGTDVQPDLICNNCGTPFPAAEPTTIDTEDPQAGADPMESEDPETQEEGLEGGGDASEGDVCPACGKGVLVSGDELEAEGEGLPPEAAGDESESDEDEDGDGVPDDEETDEEDDEEPGPVDPREIADNEPSDDEEDSDDDDDEPAKKGKNPFKK